MNGYNKYQTFDEYILDGVVTNNVKSPYVLVKKTNDTIFVIKSNNKNDTIKYTKKGNYWYTKLYIEETQSFLDKLFNNSSSKLLKIQEICEKFIYNDTVIEFLYREDEKLRMIDQTIYVNTKQHCLELVIQNDDLKDFKNLFDGIQTLVNNYKTIFPIYSPKYQSRWYNEYEKIIKNNTLNIYEIDSSNLKKFVTSKKLNSLGEFDNKGKLAWWF